MILMGWKKETVFKLNPRVKRPQGLRRFHNQKAHPSHTPLFCEYRMCRVPNVINGIPDITFHAMRYPPRFE